MILDLAKSKIDCLSVMYVECQKNNKGIVYLDFGI